MGYEVVVKGMVPIKVLKEQFPTLEPIFKAIPEDAWATVDEQGNLVIGVTLFTYSSMPVQELQSFHPSDQEKWSGLCMRGILIQLEQKIDEKMKKLADVGEKLVKVIGIKHYG
jgi:hypothetical protein